MYYPSYPYFTAYGQPSYGVGAQGQPIYQPQATFAQNGSQSVTQQGAFQQPAQPQMSNIEYVNGIEGVKALILPPNSKRILLDSERKYFYIKSTDGDGKPRIEIHPYSDENPEQPKAAPAPPKEQFVTLAQFGEQQKVIRALQAEIEKLKNYEVKK